MLGTLGTWEAWELETLTWESLPGNLGNLCLATSRSPFKTMQTCTNPQNLGDLEKFGNLYGTFSWEPSEPLLGNLGNWEPLLGNLANFGEAWESLLGNLGNLYLGILGTCTLLGNLATLLRNLGNLYLGTLRSFTREPWEPLLANLGNLANLGTFTWEPCALGNLGNLYLGTLGTFTSEPWEPLLGNVGNLYLGTLRTWEPWEPLLGNLGNLGTLGTFTREPWEPWENRFRSCSDLLRNLYYG